MVKHSVWNRVDIHIHSKKSNEVKSNDYKGDEYTGKQLLDKLLENNNNINIFSITDHNCINEKLYKEIDDLIKEDNYKDKINYLIGTELDVYDENIYKEVFHCLVFFECRDISKVKKSVDSIFNNCPLSERNVIENYPTINEIFSKLNENNIQNIILMPHFNNKTKGLPQYIAIENLNYLCFNAYEDSNNIANINKSLNIYLKAGYDNFPFAVFSDCHNINIYPGEDSDGFIPCYMLGNLDYPFNSIKTAFQEPRLRLHLENIDNVRKMDTPDDCIKKIFMNDSCLELSPYQNTIIGKFGSGKSLLLEKIKKGSMSLKDHDKYSEFFSADEKFKLEIANGVVNSIDEVLSINRNIKKYEFLQQEDYSFKSFLTLDEAKKLFNRININYDFIKDKIFDFNIDNLVSCFNDLYSKINSVGDINNINYEKAFTDEEYYSINLKEYETNYNIILEELKQNNTDINNLKTKKISNVLLFNEDELNNIGSVIEIVNNKKEIIEFLNSSIFESDLKEMINSYNQEYINNNAKQSKDKFSNDLDLFLISIEAFQTECNVLQKKYNSKIHEEYKKPIIKQLYEHYDISATFNNVGEYKDPIKSIFKDSNRKEDVFLSFISLISSKEKFAQNKTYAEFKNVLVKYCDSVEEAFKGVNVAYDIFCNGKSMLKQSAGEKSSLFIKLIFDLIENDLQNNKSILLILDQPESNIDNDNIYTEISNKLRRLKVSYNNFQSIIVTHNANVGITADSENIIIANEIIDNKNIKNFEYRSGCIENNTFIDCVCKILEGGKDAMKQRTTKYGINIIKKVKKNEL